MPSIPALHRFERRRGFTLIETMVGTAILMGLVIASTSFTTVVIKRLANERTRYNLSIQNARAVSIITELSRRAVRVAIYPDISTAETSVQPLPDGEMVAGYQPPAAQGDVMAFVLADGTARFIVFENTSINLYTGSGFKGDAGYITIAGGTPGVLVTSSSADSHCLYVQGLAQINWLAEAQTTQGWSEQITYSAFAVPLRNR